MNELVWDSTEKNFTIHSPKNGESTLRIANNNDSSNTFEATLSIIIPKNTTQDITVLVSDNHNTKRHLKVDVTLEENSSLNYVFLQENLGEYSQTITANFNGESSHLELSGVVILDNKSDVTNRTRFNHNVPNTTANQTVKTILTEKSQSLFNGLVFVNHKAHGTDSTQNNPNLLLSDDAKALTQPQLEIFADDVVCGHGANVGQLDEASIFYLQSRGLSRQQAKMFLLEGFAIESIANIKNQSLLNEVTETVKSALKRVLHE